MEVPNTIFMRLEGVFQAWGDPSKFIMRRTMDAPTKSGVIGMLCCAMGMTRQAARERLPKFNSIEMGVRIDIPGTRWWDYQTVGARYGILTAEGNVKKTASTKEYETLVTRREYLANASFLVALLGDPEMIVAFAQALQNPRRPLFLGRKSCSPTRPIYAGDAHCDDMLTALRLHPWRPRYEIKERLDYRNVICLLEWRQSETRMIAPYEAEVWYDVPISFEPPVHEPRLLERKSVEVQIGDPMQRHTQSPTRPQANYRNSDYRKARDERLLADHGLCVFCKAPATTVQHITYRHAGGGESNEDLRSLCRLCHDAVTMIEYGIGMGLDRINPEDPRWRIDLIRKRREIIEFRSLETRSRRLRAEEEE